MKQPTRNQVIQSLNALGLFELTDRDMRVAQIEAEFENEARRQGITVKELHRREAV